MTEARGIGTVKRMTTSSRRTPAVLIVASVLAAAVTLLGPAAQASPADTYGHAARRATNAVRHAHGLPRLHADRCLERYAAAQARRMARQGRMFHQDIRVALRRCHLREIGENVAYGYPSGRAVVRQGWMRSAPHRANILHRSYRLLAVEARKGADGRWYASQLFGRR